uniref:Uncharacterized protein n=1 Tax=Leersia perrieri TaxID=77586 RepID=A0A0D9XUX0_9ORYZ
MPSCGGGGAAYPAGGEVFGECLAGPGAGAGAVGDGVGSLGPFGEYSSGGYARTGDGGETLGVPGTGDDGVGPTGTETSGGSSGGIDGFPGVG